MIESYIADDTTSFATYWSKMPAWNDPLSVIAAYVNGFELQISSSITRMCLYYRNSTNSNVYPQLQNTSVPLIPYRITMTVSFDYDSGYSADSWVFIGLGTYQSVPDSGKLTAFGCQMGKGLSPYSSTTFSTRCVYMELNNGGTPTYTGVFSSSNTLFTPDSTLDPHTLEMSFTIVENGTNGTISGLYSIDDVVGSTSSQIAKNARVRSLINTNLYPIVMAYLPGSTTHTTGLALWSVACS